MPRSMGSIQGILNENLDIDPATVAVDSTFESLGIDSLDMVELVCEIENRFDIELGEAEGLDTVGKLVDYIDGLK